MKINFIVLSYFRRKYDAFYVKHDQKALYLFDSSLCYSRKINNKKYNPSIFQKKLFVPQICMLERRVAIRKESPI